MTFITFKKNNIYWNKTHSIVIITSNKAVKVMTAKKEQKKR